ncbi:hypothetical protein [Oleiagrimonas sp. C23AA]|uniref:hypothetical protein n=1 Tax=Oleiagrimonas sp. C23AA TaxID=2719047 RepID=UPI00141DAD0E|nr:hypothetical protein [Oleiagrimonas sp. C23AA]NII11065.1 hypothetical protein [Oleiagrimonas sp. C23AA]
MLYQATDKQTSKDTPIGWMAVLSGFNYFDDYSCVEQEIAQAGRIATGGAVVECTMSGVETGELPTGTDCAALALTIDSFLMGLATQSGDGAAANTLHKEAELLMGLWGLGAPSAESFLLTQSNEFPDEKCDPALPGHGRDICPAPRYLGIDRAIGHRYSA